MKNNTIKVIALALTFFIGIAAVSAQSKKVYHFKVEEEIAKPAVMRVEKALAEAAEKHCDVVVMQLNTFGGELESADKIRTMLLQSEGGHRHNGAPCSCCRHFP